MPLSGLEITDRGRFSVTLYLCLWDHWEGKEGAFALVKEHLKSGKFKDWGLFAGSGRGYVLVDASSEAELLQLAGMYREFGVRFLNSEPVISAAQVEKLLGG